MYYVNLPTQPNKLLLVKLKVPSAHSVQPLATTEGLQMHCPSSESHTVNPPNTPGILHLHSSQPFALMGFKFQKNGLHLSQIRPLTRSLH